MSLFIVVATVWAGSGTAYWLFRSNAPRRFSAYAAGRLDTLFAIFGVSTYALVICGAWLALT
jgi:hypothetical protein